MRHILYAKKESIVTNKDLEAKVAELQAQLEAKPAVDLRIVDLDKAMKIQGWTDEVRTSARKAKEKADFDAKITGLPQTEAVQNLKTHIEGLDFPVRITIECLKDAKEATINVQRPGSRGPTSNGRNGQVILYGGTVNGGETIVDVESPDQEKPGEFSTFKALCDALAAATGSDNYDVKGQSAKVVLERNKVDFALIDKE